MNVHQKTYASSYAKGSNFFSHQLELAFPAELPIEKTQAVGPNDIGICVCPRAYMMLRAYGARMGIAGL